MEPGSARDLDRMYTEEHSVWQFFLRQSSLMAKDRTLLSDTVQSDRRCSETLFGVVRNAVDPPNTFYGNRPHSATNGARD